MTCLIHPSATIEPGATLGAGCRVGPYCYIGPHVTLGSDNVLHAHSVIDGYTTMGDVNEVFPFSCLGSILERNGFSQDQIGAIRSAYRILLRTNLPLRPAIARLQLEYADSSEVQAMVAFAESSVVGLARPRNGVTTPKEDSSAN